MAEARLGSDLAGMLESLAHRGPDSSGFAIYGEPAPGAQLSVLAPALAAGWSAELARELMAACGAAEVRRERGDQAILTVDAPPGAIEEWLRDNRAELVVLAVGRGLEVAKRTGHPATLVAHTRMRAMSGSHAVAHARMATESRVSSAHSHPFFAGDELCLVHNGSLSNHNGMRRRLESGGADFQTDNDSEVAARFIAATVSSGAPIEDALRLGVEQLDGFFTLVVAGANGLALARDPVACKPALVAESEEWVAIASEMAAIHSLPGGAEGEIWEPEAASVHSWQRPGAQS